MDNLLERAFMEAAKLPETEQRDFAAWILEELEERRWQKRFAETQEALGKLADKALAEYEAGLTEPFDPDEV